MDEKYGTTTGLYLQCIMLGLSVCRRRQLFMEAKSCIPLLDAEINNALTQGRQGRGCIVILLQVILILQL